MLLLQSLLLLLLFLHVSYPFCFCGSVFLFFSFFRSFVRSSFLSVFLSFCVFLSFYLSVFLSFLLSFLSVLPSFLLSVFLSFCLSVLLFFLSTSQLSIKGIPIRIFVSIQSIATKAHLKPRIMGLRNSTNVILHHPFIGILILAYYNPHFIG